MHEQSALALQISPREFESAAVLLHIPFAVPLEGCQVAIEESAEATILYSQERAERADAVGTFVRGLTQLQRTTVHAIFWRGLSQAEVARQLGVSKPAVTKTLRRVYARGRAELAHVAAAT